MGWGAVGLGLGAGSSHVCLPVLHSLKGLGLGRDHEGGRCGPRQVPGVVFGSNRGLCAFGGHHRGVGWRGLREAGGLSVFLERCHGRRAGAGPALSAVVHHGLGGGGTGARAARARRRQGVGLHQLGFGGLCVLPEVRKTEKAPRATVSEGLSGTAATDAAQNSQPATAKWASGQKMLYPDHFTSPNWDKFTDTLIIARRYQCDNV